ncbi:MAG: GNAT family N-acetyltransferase [Chloroflexota bacterium]
MSAGFSFEVRGALRHDLPSVQALMRSVIARDYGYEVSARWHEDVLDPGRFFLDNPRHALLVAVGADGAVLGTAGVRVLRITAPPHPGWVVARYDHQRTAELTRVFVDPSARRSGIGAALVRAARARVALAGGFDVIAFHSRTAVDFWRAMPTREIADTRVADGLGPEGGQVYFEMDVQDPSASSAV